MRCSFFAGIGAVFACSLLTAPSGAATYDLNMDFGTSPFQYGQGLGGATFVEFTHVVSCNGSLSCYDNNTSYPNIQYNPDANPWSVNFGAPYGSLTVPAYGIDMSTGIGNDPDTIVRFITPTASSYSIAGAFSWLVTNNGFSDGVVTSIYRTSGGISTILASTTLAQGEPFTGFAFDLDNVLLAQGDVIDFVVSNNGNNSFDAIGLTGAITTSAVPEPAAWIAMIAGFGVVGRALRARRKPIIRFN